MLVRKRFLALGACLSAAACNSVEWRETTSTETWRGATLREAEYAAVVAVNESEAAEVYRFYAELVEAMGEAGLDQPAPPLLVAVESDRPQLLGDEASTRAAIEEWYPDAAKHRAISPVQGGDAPLEMAVPMMILHPPIESPRLALPEPWRQRYHQVFLVASETCLSVVIDRLLDLGLEREKVSFAERLLMAPFMPMLRGKMRRLLGEQRRIMLLKAVLPADHVDPIAFEICLRALGLQDSAALSQPTSESSLPPN